MRKGLAEIAFQNFNETESIFNFNFNIVIFLRFYGHQPFFFLFYPCRIIIKYYSNIYIKTMLN